MAGGRWRSRGPAAARAELVGEGWPETCGRRESGMGKERVRKETRERKREGERKR